LAEPKEAHQEEVSRRKDPKSIHEEMEIQVKPVRTNLSVNLIEAGIFGDPWPHYDGRNKLVSASVDPELMDSIGSGLLAESIESGLSLDEHVRSVKFPLILSTMESIFT
jgi:hypothetical protein